MPRKLYSPMEKRRLYSDFKKSGLTITEFAYQNGVSKSAFSQWVKEIENKQPLLSSQALDELLKPIILQSNDMPSKSSQQPPNEKVCIEFIMPNNIVIKLPIGKDIHLLVEILQAIII